MPGNNNESDLWYFIPAHQNQRILELEGTLEITHSKPLILQVKKLNHGQAKLFSAN